MVHLCPAVPTAENKVALTARSRSASSITITALFPPNSRIDRPMRWATAGPTMRPMLQDPVAEIRGRRVSWFIRSPTVAPSPTTRLKTPSKPLPSMTCWAMRVTAMAVRGVRSDGFHTTVSPHTAARAEFHDQTATGKLNAEITPTGPSGCQCSYIRWLGRSEAMVAPYSWRDRPTAKSQMSTISWTSPIPSGTILPISSVTNAPSGSIFSRRASPSSRTYWPRWGAGRSCHLSKVSTDWATTRS